MRKNHKNPEKLNVLILHLENTETEKSINLRAGRVRERHNFGKSNEKELTRETGNEEGNQRFVNDYFYLHQGFKTQSNGLVGHVFKKGLSDSREKEISTKPRR